MVRKRKDSPKLPECNGKNTMKQQRKDEVKGDRRGSFRRSSRLSSSEQHNSLYAFQVDTPPATGTKPMAMKVLPARQKQKVALKTKALMADSRARKVVNSYSTKQGSSQGRNKKTVASVKRKSGGKVDVDQVLVTPKTRTSKVISLAHLNNAKVVVKRKTKTLQPIAQPNLDEVSPIEQSKAKNGKSERILKPIPQPNLHEVSPVVDTSVKKDVKKEKTLKQRVRPNLDDVSPIVRKDSLTPGQKRTRAQSAANVSNAKMLATNKAGFADSLLESPPVSFLGQSSVTDDDNDDSAVFVSPRKVTRKLQKGQTSTPAGIMVKTNNRSNQPAKRPIKAKDTSTPVETKSKTFSRPTFTQIKPAVMDISPVPMMETPTSDYGSMESSYMSPSPRSGSVKKKQKAGSSSPTPAFSLEDDIEVPSLNKSLNKVYKKASKKKYESSKTMASKLEEWAEKVNSEMEDIENFELSVEG